MQGERVNLRILTWEADLNSRVVNLGFVVEKFVEGQNFLGIDLFLFHPEKCCAITVPYYFNNQRLIKSDLMVSAQRT
jgi:hypothetical protein